MRKPIFIGAFLACIVVLTIAGTKISRLTRTTTIQGNSLFLVVTGANDKSTRAIEATNLIDALSGLPNWPIGGSGGGGSSNANQFGAAGNVSTIKDGALLTNTTTHGIATNKGTLKLQRGTAEPEFEIQSTLYPLTLYGTSRGIGTRSGGAQSYLELFPEELSSVYFYSNKFTPSIYAPLYDIGASATPFNDGYFRRLFLNGTNVETLITNIAAVAGGGGGSGEANVNGEVSVTNGTKIGLVYGKAGVTNLLRSIQAGNGIVLTNQGTNIAGGIDPSIVASQANLTVVSNYASTKQFGSDVLTNLSGTVGRNVTNVVSLSTSNATSKPLTNSYTAGALTLFGLEAGGNVSITPNASNLVISASVSGSGVSTNGTQFGASSDLTLKSGLMVTNMDLWGGFTNHAVSTFSAVVTNNDRVWFNERIAQVDPLLSATFGILQSDRLLVTNKVELRGTNFAGTIALPNVVTNALTMTGGGSNLVAATIGPGVVFSGGVLSTSSGGTNYPFVIQLGPGTNTTVGSSNVQHQTIITNATLNWNFQGTPFQGEQVALSVSNNSASTIYATNRQNGTVTSAYDPYVGSNVTAWAILPNSISTFTFKFMTNFNQGSFRQELQWSSEKSFFLIADGNCLQYLTNGNVITITNTCTSGITTITNDGLTNSTFIGLVHGTAAVKTVTAGANVTLTDRGSNILIAAASATLNGELDTATVTNRLRMLTQTVTPATDGWALINLAKSANVHLILTTNTVGVVFSNVVDGIFPGRLLVQQDTNGSRSIGVWSNATTGLVITNEGAVLTLTTNANALDVFEISSYFGTNVLLEAPVPAGTSLPTAPAVPMLGATLTSVAGSPTWSFGTPNGRWAINEEFWTQNKDTSLQHGDLMWDQSRLGTYVVTNNGALGFGLWTMTPRTAGARYAITLGQAGLPYMRLTNSEMLFLARVMTSMVDGGGDTNTLKIGFGDSISAEFSNGIYWRNTNNVWELVTARSGSRTVTATASNLLANTWTDLAWYLDSTGTNVFGYIGTSATNMACVATNRANIPHDTLTQPEIYVQRGLTNSLAGMTNFIDYFKLWVKHQ